MPLFLIPFVILAAGNTRMHKTQADAAPDGRANPSGRVRAAPGRIQCQPSRDQDSGSHPGGEEVTRLLTNTWGPAAHRTVVNQFNKPTDRKENETDKNDGSVSAYTGRWILGPYYK
jgi:hypothetical protein